MRIREIMTPRPETIAPQALLSEAARRMKSRDTGVLPVCDIHGRIIGILTDRDIALRVVAEGVSGNLTTVREVMTADPHCCYEDEDVGAAAQRMQDRQIRRMTVLDRQDNLVGSVALSDFANLVDGVQGDLMTARIRESVSMPAQAQTAS